jgi:hypothetical protein
MTPPPCKKFHLAGTPPLNDGNETEPEIPPFKRFITNVFAYKSSFVKENHHFPTIWAHQLEPPPSDINPPAPKQDQNGPPIEPLFQPRYSIGLDL